MRTYYIHAVQSPDQRKPVVYRTETHRPRYEGEPVAQYTQAYVATASTSESRYAVGSVRAKNAADALSRFFE